MSMFIYFDTSFDHGDDAAALLGRGANGDYTHDRSLSLSLLCICVYIYIYIFICQIGEKGTPWHFWGGKSRLTGVPKRSLCKKETRNSR